MIKHNCFSALGLIALALMSSVKGVEDVQASSIHIVTPFSRALPPSSKNGAVYLKLINHGHRPDKLIGATTPIAEHVEIHTYRMEDGMMKMRKVDQVELPPHKEVAFVPGGRHIMLVGLSKPLNQGERFNLIFHFREAGSIMTEVTIEAVSASSASQGEHEHRGPQKHQAEDENVGHDPGSPTIQVHLAIKGGKVADGHGVIQVTQGDHVTFHITSDEVHNLHVHGYDIEVEVSPTSPAIVNFRATATGRFPVEVHGSSNHGALFYLEVHPK